MENPLGVAGARRGTGFSVYPASGGGWIYEVWENSKPMVVGCSLTRAAAEHEAEFAQLHMSRVR